MVGVDRQIAATGAGASYSSGPTGTTTNATEFVFGAVALFAGSAPTWNSGRHAITTYAINSDFLGRAYQVSTTPGSFAARGSGSGTWLATTVTFGEPSSGACLIS